MNPAIEDLFRKKAQTLGKLLADTSHDIAGLFPVILPSLQLENRPSQNKGSQRPNYLPLFSKSGNVAPTAQEKKQVYA